MKASFKERFFSAFAYIFGIPALYVVLTKVRAKRYLGFHGAQAFVLWATFIVCFFALRYIINMIWSQQYIERLEVVEIIAVVLMGLYLVLCAYRALIGVTFKIPH